MILLDESAQQFHPRELAPEFLFIRDLSMRTAWAALNAVRGSRPLALTVCFGAETERLARLPLAAAAPAVPAASRSIEDRLGGRPLWAIWPERA